MLKQINYVSKTRFVINDHVRLAHLNKNRSLDNFESSLNIFLSKPNNFFNRNIALQYKKGAIWINILTSYIKLKVKVFVESI